MSGAAAGVAITPAAVSTESPTDREYQITGNQSEEMNFARWMWEIVSFVY